MQNKSQNLKMHICIRYLKRLYHTVYVMLHLILKIAYILYFIHGGIQITMTKMKVDRVWHNHAFNTTG